MAVYTFFGHSNCPDSIMTNLQNTLESLIINYDVNVFYVGNHGNFDSLVLSALEKLTYSFPHIHYAVVLAYMPTKQNYNKSGTVK